MKQFILILAVAGLSISEPCYGSSVDRLSHANFVHRSNNNHVTVFDNHEYKAEPLESKRAVKEINGYVELSKGLLRIAIGSAAFAKTAFVCSEFSKTQMGILFAGIGLGCCFCPTIKKTIEVGAPIVLSSYKFCGEQIYKGIRDVRALHKEGFSYKTSQTFGDKFKKSIKLSESFLRIMIGSTVFAKTAIFCSGFSKMQLEMLCIGIGTGYCCCPDVRDFIKTMTALAVKGYGFFGNQIYEGIQDIWKMYRYGQY